ncbi:hypothetical protein FHG87_000940 [Trinorchestia longiramus]|nr:hypothetical protein FHG87_000940 [Trinorchestia longiramus]
MAPLQIQAEEMPAPKTELQKVVKPCSETLLDSNQDIELCIFRIPKGLLDVNNLVNCEISLGSKKASEITIKGKKFEITSQPLEDGAPVLPWLPDSKGLLHPVTPESSVVTEVSVRRCLNAGSTPGASEDDLEYLKPVEHIPPDLPGRDFFSGYNSTFAAPVRLKKKKSPKQTPNSSDSARQKSRLSIEEITPLDPPRRPHKKKKGDPLAANFQNVFNDICSSPSGEAVTSCSVESPKKSKKKVKDLGADRQVKQEVFSPDELDQSPSHASPSETPEQEKKSKGKKMRSAAMDDDVQYDLSSSSASSKAEKKKKKKKRMTIN